MATEQLQGPASYFPSIEKKHGMPTSHSTWLLEVMPGARHSDMVALLETDHAMGHGHADAIAAYHRAEHGL